VTDRFTPDSGLHAGEMCEGARVVMTDRTSLESMRMGIEIAAALAKLGPGNLDVTSGYPGYFDVTKIIALVGNAETIRRLGEGDPPASIVASWKADMETFRKTRAKYLLYQ
jgi:uncharacterized protein YbbC (DUF1343 family)